MLLSPRLSSKYLAEFAHRLGMELAAGIDIRRVWQREADHASGRLATNFAAVRDSVAQGDSLSVAMAKTGNLFPRMFLEMVHVGEQTGMLAEVLRRLAEHYRHKVEMRRTFLGLIAWPLIQLSMAAAVIGIMILVMGMIGGGAGGKPIDILGFGLVGTRGFIIYVNFLIAVGLCIAGGLAILRRDPPWIRPVQRLAMQIPVVGPAIEKLCLARLTWAMHLTLNVEMDLRRLVPLVMRAAGNDHYDQQTNKIVAHIVAGHSMADAFRATDAFPEHFLDALEVGEESGQLVESMQRLSGHYQQESESAMGTLSAVAGACVWMLVAGIIILMIFRIFGFYVGTINDAVNMTL